MFRSPTEPNQRGMAAMEALLSMPVVMVVVVLLFNFSSAVIQKARARVAVREIAFRHLIDAAAVDASQSPLVYAGTWPGIRGEVRRKGWVEYTFREKSLLTRGFKELTGSHPAAEKNDLEMQAVAGDDDGGSGFMDLANRMLAGLGGQRDFEVWLRADVPFEGAIAPGARDPMFPRAEFHASLAIDSSPWTRHELPCGYLDVLGNALGLGTVSEAGIGLESWLGCGEEETPYDPGFRNADEAAQRKAEADEAARREAIRLAAEERARKAEEARKNGGG